jgi:hypothetical protein
MSTSNKIDYMAHRLKYLPSQLLSDSRLEQNEEHEEIRNGSEVILPDPQFSTLQEKLKLAASKRLLQEHNLVLRKALELIQRLPPKATYDIIVDALGPQLLA